MQKTADSIFNGKQDNAGQEFTLVQESEISSPKSGGFRVNSSGENNIPNRQIMGKEVPISTSGPTETANLSPSMQMDQSAP